jgi:hypothetical protein
VQAFLLQFLEPSLRMLAVVVVAGRAVPQAGLEVLVAEALVPLADQVERQELLELQTPEAVEAQVRLAQAWVATAVPVLS